MYRLRRLRLENIGHQDARFRAVTLDLTGHRLTADGSAVPSSACDAILWLRNGGGKSSLLALLFSLLVPAKTEFIGNAKQKSLADYVIAGQTAHVIAEWEDDTSLFGGAALITGGVYQWADGVRPREPDAAWDRLQRTWYVLRPKYGVLDLDTLPVVIDGQPVSSERYTRALATAMASDHSLDVGVTHKQTKWEQTLTRHGLDPRIFRVQKEMNRDEGAITELFSFASPERFLDFLIDLVVDPADPVQVRANLEQQAATMARKPAFAAEQRFLAAAMHMLGPVQSAAAAVTGGASALLAAVDAAERLAWHQVLAAAALERQAGAHSEQALADEEQARASRRIRDARRRSRLAVRRHQARLAVVEAEAALTAATGRAERANAVADAWEAVPTAQLVRTQTARRQDLLELLEEMENQAAPLRQARQRAARRLVDALDRVISADTATRQDLLATRRAAQTQIGLLDGQRTGRLSRAAAARASAEAARAQLSSISEQAAQARVAASLGPDDDLVEALVRLSAEHEQAEARDAEIASRREEAGRRATELAGTRGTATGAVSAAGQAYEVVWDRFDQLRAQARRLAEHPRLIEATSADTSVQLDAAGQRLVDALLAEVDAAERRLVEEAVSNADDVRGAAELEQSGFLPGALDVERAAQALTQAGVPTVTGLQFLRDVVTAAQHPEVLQRYPHLAGGVVALGDVSRTDLQTALSRCALATTVVVHAATGHDVRRLFERGPGNVPAPAAVPTGIPPVGQDRHEPWAASPGITLALRPALLDRAAADAEQQRVTARLAEADGRRRDIASRRENDRALAAELRAHLALFAPQPRARLQAELDRVETERDAADAALAAVDAEIERSHAHAEELKREHAGLTVRLQGLRRALPALASAVQAAGHAATLLESRARLLAEADEHDREVLALDSQLESARQQEADIGQRLAVLSADLGRFGTERTNVAASLTNPGDVDTEQAPARAQPAGVTELEGLRVALRQTDAALAEHVGAAAHAQELAVVQDQLATAHARLGALAPQIRAHAEQLAVTAEASEPSRLDAVVRAAAAARATVGQEVGAAKLTLTQARELEKERLGERDLELPAADADPAADTATEDLEVLRTSGQAIARATELEEQAGAAQREETQAADAARTARDRARQTRTQAGAMLEAARTIQAFADTTPDLRGARGNQAPVERVVVPTLRAAGADAGAGRPDSSRPEDPAATGLIAVTAYGLGENAPELSLAFDRADATLLDRLVISPERLRVLDEQHSRQAVETLQTELNGSRRAYDTAVVALTKSCGVLAAVADQPDFTVVDAPLRARLKDGPETLRRTAGTLGQDVAARSDIVTAQLEAIERDQQLVTQSAMTLVKRLHDELEQVSRHSVVPDGLGAWTGKRFLDLSMGSWGTDDELTRRVNAELEAMVALVGPEHAAKASPLPDAMRLAKRLLLAGIGGPGHTSARILKPKPELVVERVPVTEIQKFSGGELLTVSVLLYCTLAKLRAANRGRGTPGGVGTLVLDNPLGKATYVLFLKLQRQVATAHGVQLVYATAVKDLSAVGQFPLVLRLRNGTDGRTRRQYVQIAERFGDAISPQLRAAVRAATEPPADGIDAVRVAHRQDPLEAAEDLPAKVAEQAG